MDIYLSIKNRAEEIKLPTLPSSFTVGSGYNNEIIQTISNADIKHIGNKKLNTIEISAFFPQKDYPFLRDRSHKGFEYVDILEKWRSMQIPIRLIITETNINMACTIDDFSYSLQDGTGDVYYSLIISEYRFVDIQKLVAIPIEKPKPIIEVVTKKATTSGKYSSSSNSNVKAKASSNIETAKSESATKAKEKLESAGIKFNANASEGNTITSTVESLYKERDYISNVIKESKPPIPTWTISKPKTETFLDRYENWYNTNIKSPLRYAGLGVVNKIKDIVNGDV